MEYDLGGRWLTNSIIGCANVSSTFVAIHALD